MRQISLSLEQNKIDKVFLKFTDNYYTPRLGILKGIPHLALFLSDFRLRRNFGPRWPGDRQHFAGAQACQGFRAQTSVGHWPRTSRVAASFS